MKKLLLSVIAICCVAMSVSSCGNGTVEKISQYGTKYTVAVDNVITVKSPTRPQGQENVLGLRTEPIKNVRIAVIGLGMRGVGAVNRMSHISGTEIVALCDVLEANTQKANKMLESLGKPKALEFYGDTSVWRKVTALENVDLIYIATDWASHATIGVQAMNDGKHTAIEVPAAMSLNEIWDLINTSERTRKHCMQLENCVYDFFELTTLNMAQQGLFGEILHTEGAYIHNLEPFWKDYWNDWRLEYNINNHGDLYPTHGIGPVCQALNIHRGDKMNYLVSMQTKTVSIPEFIKKTQNRDVAKDFKNGDHTITLIKTEKGKTINIQHNVATPRPYNRMYQLTGTKGFANKYPTTGYALQDAGQFDKALMTGHEDLSGHSFVSKETEKALFEKYKHPIHVELEEKAKQVGGHGGMDFIMDYRLIYCLQNGLPLDMDVYDLAEWCAPIELSSISINNNSAPVKVPDFTRGHWNDVQKLEFAY